MTSLELSQLPLLRNLTMESGEMTGLQEFVLKDFSSLTTVVVKAHFAALSRFELQSGHLDVAFSQTFPRFSSWRSTPIFRTIPPSFCTM